ncbi:Double Clp-N motif-containing P-loop nucleoside triphosphate hydrolase superfamily protein [Abeliophyllum distichum]|uniref:Double Clp-N motif-containing P-loop nucleoside triphosphate hydrolase superfamily protein n=1 Tax=Abeliophyllum distichum TaxID=126358 RepID=A0ABD1RD70_9LAMI
MPTPVSTARQCLTEEAARALDGAVSVAKRRSHAQTTTLHVLSALIALPSSILREACSRARRSAYSPRLQFRALELSAGVSLDRLPSSKGASDEPPISNSLMTAIKRSQANQRRHPETFHLYQQLNSCQPSISAVKVELKHFVLSILDDPIVSRVFGEAGFWSTDIKFAILNPPTISRFAKTRCPPLFSGNFSELELNKRGFNFPFPGVVENVDENSRRVGQILVKENLRNPLLIGVCANDALKNFVESLQRGKIEVLPKEIYGLSVISIEKEISEFINGGLSEDRMRLKFIELRDMVAKCEGPGIILNYGDLRVFVDVESVDAVNFMVSELKRLLNNSGGKLWLIGAVADDNSYKKLLARFSSIETDWDLHLLPITSSIEGLSSRSSLMGSFIPFGGFFPLPSEYEPPSTSQSSTLCNLCKEKYAQEVSVLKGGPTDSVVGQQSENLSSWLQIAERDLSKSSGAVEAKDDKTVLDAKVTGLQRKWSDICQHLHRTRSFQEENSPRSQFLGDQPSQVVSVLKESTRAGSLLDEGRITNLSPCNSLDLQNKLKPVASDIDANAKAELQVQGWKIHQLEMNVLQNPSRAQHNWSLPVDCTLSPSVTPVTTDLGLGTLYACAGEERRNFNPKEHYDCTPYFSGSSRTSENTSHQVAQSSYCSYGQLEKRNDGKDLEYPWKVLAENVYWQIEAIRTISQTVSRCRTGNGSSRGSDKRNVWFSFLGPDKVGKRKIAAALAETIFGRKGHLLSVDVDSQFEIRVCNSIFDHQDSEYYGLKKFGRKMVVDYIAEELSRRPHSVVLIENIERADFLVQNSLSQAIKIGKFRDSHGREIGINNAVFVLTSRFLKAHDDLFSGKVSYEFSEEIISDAKNFQMQILVGSTSGSYSRNRTGNVLVTPSKVTAIPCSVNKRKLVNNESTKAGMPKRMCEMSRSILDLNLPIEEMEQDSDIDKCDSESNYEVWLEELLGHVDENVVFKPFDFDSLAQKILNVINFGFQKVVGPDSFLEIDREVMVQILAAAWLTGREKAVEDWIEQVLFSSLMEAHQRCHVTDSVMKLVACEGLVVEEQFSGVCLPTRIILN